MDIALAVRARGITKCFGDVIALDGVDLDVAPGSIHGSCTQGSRCASWLR
ncbi:MAG TPA: hypothetical protein VH307_06960 [Streptosporangiaceae bacterium]|jgi:ABC-2 type transport system ATP-binding protein|nr:hypothetical protein [Streptosporangiaceae bacterium]